MSPSEIQKEGRVDRCEDCGRPLSARDKRLYEEEGGEGPPRVCEDCAERPAFPGVAEVLHCTTYRFNEVTGEFDVEQAADVAGFLKRHPTGTVYRIHAGAPGTGFTDYRVTHHTVNTVYGVQIRSTVRELSPGEVK